MVYSGFCAFYRFIELVDDIDCRNAYIHTFYFQSVKSTYPCKSEINTEYDIV